MSVDESRRLIGDESRRQFVEWAIRPTSSERQYAEFKLFPLDPDEAGGSLGSKFGATVAKELLAFANRDPAHAGLRFEGHGYLLVGVSDNNELQGCPDFDEATLLSKIRPYIGDLMVEIHHVYLRRNEASYLVMMIEVPAPRQGDPIRTLTKHFSSMNDGAVFVRDGTQSRPANSADIRRLTDRANASVRVEGLGLKVSLEGPLTGRPFFDWCQSKRTELIGEAYSRAGIELDPEDSPEQGPDQTGLPEELSEGQGVKAPADMSGDQQKIAESRPAPSVLGVAAFKPRPLLRPFDHGSVLWKNPLRPHEISYAESYADRFDEWLGENFPRLLCQQTKPIVLTVENQSSKTITDLELVIAFDDRLKVATLDRWEPEALPPLQFNPLPIIAARSFELADDLDEDGEVIISIGDLRPGRPAKREIWVAGDWDAPIEVDISWTTTANEGIGSTCQRLEIQSRQDSWQLDAE